ncbi:hypothetical protein SUDANB145_07201 (plasmid) [Streptomyces sp. enrichment culture]
MLFATGGAATAFGVALAGQIGPLSEAADAEKKYQDAVRDHGASSAEAMEAQLAYQRQLAALPPETQRAAVALSGLKQEFQDWSDDLAGFTMAPVEKGFAVIEELLPHLTPEVESFSGSMDRLMTVAGGAVSTPGFDAISDRVAELTELLPHLTPEVESFSGSMDRLTPNSTTSPRRSSTSCESCRRATRTPGRSGTSCGTSPRTATRPASLSTRSVTPSPPSRRAPRRPARPC